MDFSDDMQLFDAVKVAPQEVLMILSDEMAD